MSPTSPPPTRQQPASSPAYPAGTPLPWASNLNLEAPGQTLPNHISVRLGTGGAFTLYTQSGAHLIADLTGYYLA